MLILYKVLDFLSKFSTVLFTILVLMYDASDDASGSVPELSLSTGATVVFNWRHCGFQLQYYSRFQLAPLSFPVLQMKATVTPVATPVLQFAVTVALSALCTTALKEARQRIPRGSFLLVY